MCIIDTNVISVHRDRNALTNWKLAQLSLRNNNAICLWNKNRKWYKLVCYVMYKLKLHAIQWESASESTSIWDFPSSACFDLSLCCKPLSYIALMTAALQINSAMQSHVQTVQHNQAPHHACREPGYKANCAVCQAHSINHIAVAVMNIFYAHSSIIIQKSCKTV